MFDISTKLVSEQDEISGLETVGWENHSWKYLSLIGDERIINLQRTKVYVFSDSVLCLAKIHQNPESNKAWEERIGWIASSQFFRNFDGIDGEPTKFEWNIFPGFDTLQLCDKVKSLLNKLGETEWNNLIYLFNISHFSSLCSRSEFQLDQQHQNDNGKHARIGRRQQDRDKVKANDDELGRL